MVKIRLGIVALEKRNDKIQGCLEFSSPKYITSWINSVTTIMQNLFSESYSTISIMCRHCRYCAAQQTHATALLKYTFTCSNDRPQARKESIKCNKIAVRRSKDKCIVKQENYCSSSHVIISLVSICRQKSEIRKRFHKDSKQSITYYTCIMN